MQSQTHCGQPLKPNTLWRYVGPDPGSGLLHKLIYAGEPLEHMDSKDLITWSMLDGNVMTGGYSWLGPIADFKKHFRAE